MAYVLIVDDDEDFSSAVAAVLRDAGHETAVLGEPDGVMASLKKRLPDAVVLDVMFPEDPVAGFDLGRAVRRAYRELPILMLTAVSQQFPLGFNRTDNLPSWLPVTEFLEKPVDFRVLREKIAGLLSAGRAGGNKGQSAF